MTKKITIGVTDLSFHRVAASLLGHIIERFGFEVERVYSPHEQNFEKLKQGDVGLLASAWLPSSHGGYKAEVEKTVPLIELGLHYEPYALWGVPEYIPASEVNTVEDLKKPSVSLKMVKKIQGINQGAGISRFSQSIVKHYHLNDLGYEFFTGTEEDCFTTFEQNVAGSKWFVVPLWKPQFLHYKHNIRELTEPEGLLGTVDKAVLLMRKDVSEMFSQEQLATLDSLRFGNQVIAELDYKVCRENLDVDAVTLQWLKENSHYLG
ncbi:glycine betaine ABC transporter substrate-binding protein [Colwellia sp. 1_MG-2023]|uniref:glycine betaine ABC transporter substrate-binding protein n=1 Tax=Colwellia sp. 1_MG-2023 TaxID=3062649 RepID=UPI0026E22288|nr:glycine betaine ABC transporter substrate-binding protein [Colwellia sp. 1_MG-2023]MDO6445438.1 glycine betaine ABC transporter substrate-binding protein [Colwellia sp. 1_MG-2023]